MNQNDKKPMGMIDKILISLFISLIIFVMYMIRLFETYGSVPDTLITCVFAAAIGECGITGMITSVTRRNQDRQWQLEDRQSEKEVKTQIEETSRV